jgi:cytochrome c oxidase subunit 4
MNQAHSLRTAIVRTLLTGGALLALAASSYGLSFVRLGAYAIAAALAIASVKAAVVAAVFMELRRRSASFQLALVAALLLLATMISLVITDVALRQSAI